jgi:formylglycine-generating enzyme required for sulfatase activity
MQIADVFPWGEQWPPPDDAGNYLGEESKTPSGLGELKAARYGFLSGRAIEGFNDGNVFTAAVGSFHPNELGIYDLGGNVWEWCQEKYEPILASRVLRGGSWFCDNRDHLLSSYRRGEEPVSRQVDFGFRAVVEAGSGR